MTGHRDRGGAWQDVLPHPPPKCATTEFPLQIDALPFDADDFLARLRSWVLCESPTWDADAVNRMFDLAGRDLAIMGATVERLPAPTGLGGVVRARMPHPHAGEKGILILAHLDTVHPIGTLHRLPWREDGERCYGPGILDMKGGLCLAVSALRALTQAGISTHLPVTFLLTGDEEIGTPFTREIIEAEASRNCHVLVPEPARPSNAVISGRYAIARFNLRARGRPSHAGARLSEGRSAIEGMARRVIEINAMTSDDATFSVGVINGGKWVNCVPDTCDAEVLVMAKRQADLDRATARMMALHGVENGITTEVERGVARPVWEPRAETLRLFETARELAGSLGMDLTHESAGGGSDGNFTGALGIPTLDGLGAKGDGAHTLHEHIEMAPTMQRGRVFAGLLARLS